MHFFNLEEGYYSLTSSGSTAFILLAVILVIAVSLIASKTRSKETKSTMSTTQLAYTGMALALAYALSYVKLWRMPWGGSVTLAMVPIVLYAVRWGVGSGLLAGFVEHLLFEGLGFFELFLVTVGEAFEGPVSRLHLGDLLVEDAAAAGDLPQVALDVDEVAAGTLLGILDHVGGQTHLPGELEGEGIAGDALLELEKRFDSSPVEQHGPVDHTSALVGVELQVGIVGGNDSVRSGSIQRMQDCLCNCPAGSRLRAGTKLVNKHQRPGIGHLEHGLHIAQE